MMPETPLLLSEALIQHLNKAHYLFNTGHFSEALTETQNALQLNPDDADILNFAGTCAATAGNIEQAKHYWNTVISLAPSHADALFNLGYLYNQQEEYTQSEYHYRQAIHFDPKHVHAWCNLGNLLHKNHNHQEAETCYRKTITIDATYEPAYSNLGNLLTREQRIEEAVQCYQHALQLNPNNGQTLSNLGLLLAQQKHYKEAEYCYQRAITIEPGNPVAYCNLGLLMEEQKEFEHAEALFRHALRLNPHSSETHSNLGNLLTHLLREQEAYVHYQQAIQLNPHSAATYCNLGVLWANQHDEDRAEQCFRRALGLNAQHALSRLNLGYLLLSQGRWPEGWTYHESRFVPKSPDRETIFPNIPFPQWLGETLSNRSLLVWIEQGFGDIIQFCRFLPLLRQQGTKHITIACKPELKPLLDTMSDAQTWVISQPLVSPIPTHDYWTFLLSIPYRLGSTLDNLPVSIPYLHPLPERIASWAPYLPQHGFRVGLIWKGYKHHSNDSHRSLPHISILSPLWSVPNVQFISLQKGQGEEEAQHPPEHQPLVHLGSQLNDFADTAAIVQQLDLIICVDTSTAHLAGALGIPCWVMLPAYKTDWRWMRHRSDSPWYPGILRLFRQTTRGDWTPVIQEITRLLDETAASYSKSVVNLYQSRNSETEGLA